jgi:hypothetical protein
VKSNESRGTESAFPVDGERLDLPIVEEKSFDEQRSRRTSGNTSRPSSHRVK